MNQAANAPAGPASKRGVAAEVCVGKRAADARQTDERARQRRQQNDPARAEDHARGDAAGDDARRQQQRAEPAHDRDSGHQAQASDLAIAGLTQQLEAQRAFGTLALGLRQLALEIETPAVAVEHFLQRGDDDAGDVSVEATGRGESRRRSRRLTILFGICTVLRPAGQRHVGHADRRVENAYPGKQP